MSVAQFGGAVAVEAGGPGGEVEQERRSGRTGYLLLLPGLLWLVIFFVVPTIQLVATGLYDPNGSLDTGYAMTWAFGNYWDVLVQYQEQFLRSFGYALVATIARSTTTRKAMGFRYLSDAYPASGNITKRISSVAYAVDEIASEANTASPTFLVSRWCCSSCGLAGGVDDPVVSGAAAQVAGQADADLLVGRVGVVGEQGRHRHDDRRNHGQRER